MHGTRIQKLNISDWIENMRNPASHGDNITLYLYDKHAYVHTAQYGWSTLPYKISMPVSEITTKCDIELALIHCWSFGEILEISRPVIPVQTGQKNTAKGSGASKDDVLPWNTADSSGVIPHTITTEDVIPQNVAGASSLPPLTHVL